ncbi:hypothetical protein EYZ11_001141 [Aspergillus tanneri]|uniref:Uncharacterized protein n=1 Tax=Aspergillus tanneri TaxID=1220188 RepID=A0A4S3JVJ0_9EURO|nr:hypothetical protein EYZ11_001141 [Aspergillus tanneri]
MRSGDTVPPVNTLQESHYVNCRKGHPYYRRIQRIGRAIAQRVTENGASVEVNYLTDATSANALVNEIGPNRALAIQADVSKVDSIRHLVWTAMARFGHGDVVILNAGMLLTRDLDGTSEADFDTCFALKLKEPTSWS